jgi:hypothetical protein
MDLRSARYDAYWHPFTGLIEHEGVWAVHAFHGLPFVVEPPMVDDRSVATIIHHELTHHACARTTRLGFAYSAEAARLLRAFRQGGDLTLTAPAKLLLGIYLPILEGLAVYAELDADERADDIIIPNPVPLHAQMIELAWNQDNSGEVLRIARESQIYEKPDKQDGLLRLLFAEPNSPETSPYLVGYLWIKTAVAHIRRINPALARPTIALPLLIKLLCDHPVIAEVWKERAGKDAIISGLLDSVLSLDQPALARIAAALKDEEALSTFELWDLHGFIADKNLSTPKLVEDTRPFFEGDEPDELVTQLRCGASLHFPSRATGLLVDVKHRDQDLDDLELETDTGERISVHLMRVRTIWRLYAGLDHYQPLIREHLHKAETLEQYFWNLMGEWKGSRVTIAQYWGIAQPPMPGIVVWHDDGRMVQLPYEPHWYHYKDHIFLTREGLKVSIDEKKRFAMSLAKTPAVTSLARQATADLLSHLVSGERARRSIIEKRLGGVLGPAAREALENWVSFPLFPPEVWSLEEPAVSELSAHFDMPGFPTIRRHFDFTELLPPLDQHGARDE